MRLFPRLVLGAFAILALAAALLLFTADRWMRAGLQRTLAHELERQARLVADAVSWQPADLNLVAHRYGALLGRRVTFVASDGTVLGDSEFDDASLALLENHRDRPEIAAALAGRTGTDRRRSASTDQEDLKVAVPAPPGAVRISASLEELDALAARNRRALLLGALAALVPGAILSALAARAVARPIRHLTRLAQRAAAGGLPAYPHSRIPEVNELVRSVHSMHDQLTLRIADLRREREEAMALFESMEQGVFAATARGEITVCNPAARRLLGFAPEDGLPNLRELFHRRDARAVVDRVLDGTLTLGEEIALEGRAVLVTARPLSGGGAVLGLLDITDLKRLQAARRDFVANVSHELKTPLTSIIGYAETLLGRDVDDATRQRFLRTIHENARRMQHLVDDLLDLARLESGGWSPAPERVDLRSVAGAAWSPLAERAREKGVNLVLDIPQGFTLRADAQAMRQILDNLLDNALRHTPGGGTITVGGAPVDGETEVVVRDTGIGIPADHIPRVFERFYRVDPGRSRQEGGTGLGLAIVRHLVDAQGGRVTLESTVGHGTVVRIRIPAPRTGAGES